MSEFWQGKQVLVTGAAGFIPSHLVEALVGRGAHVRALVRYNSRGEAGFLSELSAEQARQVEIVAGDLRDISTVRTVMQGCSHVFHLGALIAIPYSYIHPAEVVETNVIGTLNVLMAGRDTGVERIVHTSTSEVYGSAIRVPIDEEHPLQGQSPYSASKIGADKLAESFYRSFNLPVVTLRPFNTYGPRQSARAVIPTIISQALTRDRILLGSLDTRRDLTYVTDTVEGFLKVAETPGVEGETFNLGTGSDVTVAEVVNEVLSILNKKVEIVIDPSRIRPEKSEVLRLLSDNRKAGRMLNWIPAYTLHQGLEKTIEWISQNLSRYRPDQYQV